MGGGGVKKVFTHVEGGSKSFGGLRRGGSKKFDDKNFQLPSPPHQSIYEHSLSIKMHERIESLQISS